MTILHPLAWVFSFLVWIRNRCYDLGMFHAVKLPGKVISVGNLAIGGTGKSPVVTAIALDILNANGSPAIVTRGYRSGLGSQEWQVILDGKVVAGVDHSEIIADEAMMQSLALPQVPVIVGRKRSEAIRNFLAAGLGFKVSHWILDDGFQHRKIERDLDVVLLDARSPTGALIPAGKFREPLSSLKRAHMVIITKAQNPEQVVMAKKMISSVHSELEIAEVNFVPHHPKLVAGHSKESPKRWGIVAGIAKPLDFENSATEVQIVASKKLFVSDHGRFPESQLRDLERDCDAILTTEKDFARSRLSFEALRIPTFVLPLTVDWIGAKPTFIL